MKILVVEDATDLLDVLVDFLSKENYSYDAVTTYREASEKVELYDYDCILLDINLPDSSGFKLLDDLHEINKIEGVIIISARDSIDDKIKGLNLGADDYLTKPFHLSELNARIQAVVRRKKFEFLDGEIIITDSDETFPSAGLVGFWSKADAVSIFDDLKIRVLN